MFRMQWASPKSLSKASVLTLAIFVSLAGCAKVDLKGKPGQSGSTTATTETKTTTNAPVQNPGGAPPQDLGLTDVSGDWKFAFQYNNTTLNSTTHLEQQGNQFRGSGTDDQNGMAFTVEQGQLNNGQIQFFKKYEKSPPVQYAGKLEMMHESEYSGPFMSGDYTKAYKGQIISNIWQATKILANQPPASIQRTPVQQPQGQPSGQMVAQPGQMQPPAEPQRPEWPPEKAPDLSGKWEVGYEYNFKTMHSTMYLEQDGDRISGHGVDLNTKEKFTVDKGWYHFPKLTIVRKYEKGKGKNASPERSMVFKATVSMVSDKDYQGPYLNGKTQGGGMWEAQLLK